MILHALLLSLASISSGGAGPVALTTGPNDPASGPQGNGAAAVTFTGQYEAPSEPFSIWSRKPATKFTEAYPVGNGRIGATMFAGVPVERVVLNESSLWSGSVQQADRAGAASKLPAIWDLLVAGKNVEAEKLVGEAFTCLPPGSSRGEAKDAPFGCFQTLGDLELTFLAPDGKPLSGEIKNYRRSLDIKQGATFVRYEHDKAVFTRRLYAHIPQQVLVYRIACDKLKRISFDAKLTRKERAKCESVANKGLLLSGAVSDGKGGDGTSFSARLACEQLGGTLTSQDGVLSVRGANEVLLYVAMGTSYSGPIAGTWTGAGHAAVTLQQCDKALGTGYNELWKEQILSHWKPVFDHTTLDIGGNDRAKIPTLERMVAMAQGTPDPQLVSLYFLYGRYLLFTGTRSGALPLNLQGLWADEVQTPWNGDYHLNINLQMNYWPVGPTLLSDRYGPLASLMMSLVEPGKKTAQEYYGAKGWVAHTITNPWGFTSPGESAEWGSTNTCGAWLANACFDAYTYTQDIEALRKMYPALKGASEFFVDVLKEDPKNKWLVTPVSNSPENAFKLADGKTAHTCMGPTMDQQIVRDLFANTAEAARALSMDLEFAKLLDEKSAKLAPTRVGKNGAVMEWLEDYEEAEPQHRHVSHLYGLYPSNQISPAVTPELAKAAKVTLERRGDEGTGWSIAWKAAMWARLGEGDHALKLIQRLLKPTDAAGFDYVNKGGSYENLFCAHPPFQIDGNYGATAAIAEMLVQSRREKPGEDYTLTLLPALPSSWPKGELHGLGARGGLNVAVHWDKGQLDHAHIYRFNNKGGNVRIRYPHPLKAKGADGVDPGGAYADGVFVFNLEPQKTVEVSLAK